MGDTVRRIWCCPPFHGESLHDDWEAVIQSPSCVVSWPKKLGNSWRDPGISVSPGDSGFFSFLKKAEGGLCHLWDRAVAAVKFGATDEGSEQNQGEPPSCPHEPGIIMV